jgi:hypothetical protein
MGDGLHINRYFTTAGEDPFDSVPWSRRDSRITNPDGSIVFEMKNAEIPVTWSQVAADIMVSKYFRKAGVPQQNLDGTWETDAEGRPVLGAERSARQVILRLSATWRLGRAIRMLRQRCRRPGIRGRAQLHARQPVAAPNSPQWFNTGLNHRYGLTGPSQGFWFVDDKTGGIVASDDSYTRPAPHACFIQSVNDDLVNEGGIMDLWTREARLFKFGSGTGTNFSSLRAAGEPLSGGGRSSGIMSFLKIGDRAAGAIKSGGTTRRAAKMVILDVDHPDIEEFVDWKKVEEEGAPIAADLLRLQRRCLPDGLGTELQQLGADRRGLLARRGGRCRLAAHRPHRWQGDAHHQGPRPVAAHCRGRLGVCRPRDPVRHHHQPMAHLPRRRLDPRLEPVQRIHVHRQHGVQPGQPESGQDSTT